MYSYSDASREQAADELLYGEAVKTVDPDGGSRGKGRSA